MTRVAQRALPAVAIACLLPVTAAQTALVLSSVRWLLLLSLATAMTCGMAIGPYSGKETGELALFRQLLDQLDPGDILLADRYFRSWAISSNWASWLRIRESTSYSPVAVTCTITASTTPLLIRSK